MSTTPERDAALGSAAIGIDLGGTRIKAGLVDAGEVRAEAIAPVGSREPEAILDALVELVAGLDRGGRLPVGIAAAGVIDQSAGVVRESPNFPSWRDFALGSRLAARTARAVRLENDANAVIFGETRHGVARGVANVIGYTLGTGVGGGLVLGGEIYRGERGMAAELGHVTLVPEGRPCGCGNRGCLERYVGQVGLIQTLGELGPPLADLLHPDPSDAPRRLARLADDGDPRARAVFTDVGRALGQAAAALLHTLDITTFVLAGGVAGAFDHIAPAMHAELYARSFRSMSVGVRILHGTLGPHAGILGAATLAGARA